jgi:CRISPR-associated protein Csm1
MDDRINLARFAYVLTRLEPSDDKGNAEARERYRAFEKQMYAWVQNEQDRKELVTAIYLYVYLNRKEESENGDIDE